MDKRQEFHNNLKKFQDYAYENDVLPKRYVYVLTNLCNLACDFCFQDRKKQKNAMTKDDWINLTDQLPEYARVTLTGGEPLVFKDFKEVFHNVASKFECNMICNGILLNEEIIDFILSYKNFKVLSISIDNVKNTIRKLANKNNSKWDEEWSNTENMMRYFQKRKKELNSECILDSKTVVLDINANELFDIHKYCIEELQCDTHGFQFLKGSPIQHADLMFDYNEIFKKSFAATYKNWDQIINNLGKVREYNYEKQKIGFLHPGFANLNTIDNDLDIDLINETEHKFEKFKPCKAPWSSVHINVDGSLFPCLALKMGNVQDQSLQDIIYGNEFKKFKKTIREQGTVEACNRCGWLQKDGC